MSIGITPWGIVDRRNELLGRKREVAFHPVPQPRYFILFYFINIKRVCVEKNANNLKKNLSMQLEI